MYPTCYHVFHVTYTSWDHESHWVECLISKINFYGKGKCQKINLCTTRPRRKQILETEWKRRFFERLFNSLKFYAKHLVVSSLKNLFNLKIQDFNVTKNGYKSADITEILLTDPYSESLFKASQYCCWNLFYIVSDYKNNCYQALSLNLKF